VWGRQTCFGKGVDWRFAGFFILVADSWECLVVSSSSHLSQAAYEIMGPLQQDLTNGLDKSGIITLIGIVPNTASNFFRWTQPSKNVHRHCRRLLSAQYPLDATYIDRLEGLDDVQFDQPLEGFPQDHRVHTDDSNLSFDTR
jgi:hypothetical protein